MQDQHRSLLGGRRQEHTAGVEDMGYPSYEHRIDSDTFSWFCRSKIIKTNKNNWYILFPAEKYIGQRSSFGGGGAGGVIHHKKKELLLESFGLLRLCLHAFYIYCSCSSWICSMSTPFYMKGSILLSLWWGFHPSRALNRVCLAAF